MKTNKVIASVLILVFMVFAIGCGQPKSINGTTYDTYGFINQDTKKNPNIQYEVSTGNVLWSVVLFGSVVAPVYFIGFSLFNPIAPKDNTFIPGVIK